MIDLSTYQIAGIVVVLFLLLNQYAKTRRGNLNEIPTVGYSGPLTSYISAIRFLFHGQEIIQEGYDKYYGRAFKIPLLDKWMVIVSGPQLTEDVRKASDSQLSFMDAVSESVQMDYTMSRSMHNDPYHVDVIRGTLTKKLDVLFPNLHDEIVKAFKDEIPATEDWSGINVREKIMNITCRVSNRLFVGEPLCRNSNWTKINVAFAVNIMKSALIINRFPDALKPIFGPLLNKTGKNISRATKYMEPVINEWFEKQKQFGGDWPGKEDNMLSWLLPQAQGSRNNIRDLTLRILATNFAAIHTTSMAFTFSLQYLAAHPEIAAVLREEVESVYNEHQWSRAALESLPKVDSFIREVQRVLGVGAYGSQRKAMQDFVFSDGTVLPKGQNVSVALLSAHLDSTNYKNAEEIQAFRFSDLKAKSDSKVVGAGVRYNLSTPGPSFMLFGIGRHACPGRFFAVTELKSLISHVLLNYDVKFEDEGKVPPPTWISNMVIPNSEVPVLFRKRRT